MNHEVYSALRQGYTLEAEPPPLTKMQPRIKNLEIVSKTIPDQRNVRRTVEAYSVAGEDNGRHHVTKWTSSRGEAEAWMEQLAGGNPPVAATWRPSGEMPKGVTEPTAAGPQTLIPGVEPVTDKDRIRVEQERALRGGAAPMPEGGLFDEGARAQQDLLSYKVTTPDGKEIPREDYLKSAKMDLALAKLVEDCGD